MVCIKLWKLADNPLAKTRHMRSTYVSFIVNVYRTIFVGWWLSMTLDQNVALFFDLWQNTELGVGVYKKYLMYIYNTFVIHKTTSFIQFLSFTTC